MNIGERLRPVERLFDRLARIQTDFIICPMLLMHWAEYFIFVYSHITESGFPSFFLSDVYTVFPVALFYDQYLLLY